jgi:sorbitol-specific phosphotransferase system component IIC
MKVKRIVTLVITVLAVLMTVLSGVMKLVGSPDVISMFAAMGVTQYITVLGILQLTFIALFAYPPTMRIGFLLLSCYYAGALATEIFHGTTFNAVIPLGLIWIAAFLRDSSIFLPQKKSTPIV